MMEVEITNEGTLLFEVDEKFCLDDLAEIKDALREYAVLQKDKNSSYRKAIDLWMTFRKISQKADRIANQRSLEKANELQRQDDREFEIEIMKEVSRNE